MADNLLEALGFCLLILFAYAVWPPLGLLAAGGTVDFDGAQFSGGRVDFTEAQFSSGTVDFHGAQFSGGIVAFSAVSVWSVPPIGLPPEAPGLLLPEAKATRDQSSAGPVDGDEPGKDATNW